MSDFFGTRSAPGSGDVAGRMFRAPSLAENSNQARELSVFCPVNLPSDVLRELRVGGSEWRFICPSPRHTHLSWKSDEVSVTSYMVVLRPEKWGFAEGNLLVYAWKGQCPKCDQRYLLLDGPPYNSFWVELLLTARELLAERHPFLAWEARPFKRGLDWVAQVVATVDLAGGGDFSVAAEILLFRGESYGDLMFDWASADEDRFAVIKATAFSEIHNQLPQVARQIAVRLANALLGK